MAAKESSRKFDVVVLGATGFTGTLVVEFLSRNYTNRLKWAIAGRCKERLQSLKADLALPDSVDELVVDADDRASVDYLASQTRVLLSAAGPYSLIGTPIVDSCIRWNTDYCDITGELTWVRSIIDKYHDVAEGKKVRIVTCCGLDCVPSDLGVLMVSNELKRRGLVPREIRYVMKSKRAGTSGGTFASIMGQFASMTWATFRAMMNPYYLCPRDHQTGEPVEATDAAVKHRNMDTFGILYDHIEGIWECPWIMQLIDTRIVHRSNALSGWKYGRNLIYREVCAASNIFAAALSTLSFPILGTLLYFPVTREWVQRLAPKPGEGPSREALNSGCLDISLWGRGRVPSTNEEVIVRGGIESKHGDPGYKTTAKFVVEAALALVEDRASLPHTFGVLTPSVAFGDVLIHRLKQRGVDFHVALHD